MLPVSLDCPFLIAPSVFSNVYLSYVLCTQCWQCLWIVHSWLPPRLSLTSTWPVSCVINVDSAYGLSIIDCPFGFLERLFVLCLAYSMLPVSLHCPFLIAPSVFSNVYLSYVLCTQCWQCFWIVHSWLPIQFSLMFICPVSCLLNVDRTSGVSILGDPSVFSNVYLSCVSCIQRWQCLWIVHSWLFIRFSLTFICPVSCVLNADSVSALSILDCPLGFL
jgi:hypothetical protein